MEITNRTDEAIKRLREGVQEVFDSERYKAFLSTMSKFHRYSANNVLLIALQRPDATLVAGYRAWQDKFGRQVIKGSRAISILAPIVGKEENTESLTGSEEKEGMEDEQTVKGFRAVPVFDISQTYGPDLPDISPAELVGSVALYDEMIDIIQDIAPVPIRFDKIEGGAKGYYSNPEKEIVIDDRLSEKQTLKTSIHEISHAVLHDHDYLKAEDIHKDRMTMEVEAESVAFVVCSYLGLPTDDYSFPYIAGWSAGKEMSVLQDSLEVIRSTANMFLEKIEEQLEHIPRFEIYQPSERLQGSMSGYFPWPEPEELDISWKDYHRVYTGRLEGQTLKEIYNDFSGNRPDNHDGRPIQPGDVIVIHEADGTDYPFFVDGFGFTLAQDFKEREIAKEKTKEHIR